MARMEHDNYPTIDECADAIVSRIVEVIGVFAENGIDVQRIMEPAAGDGAFVRALRKAFPKAQIAAVDIDMKHADELQKAGADAALISDFLALDLTSLGIQLFPGNPPFKIADAIIRHCFKANSQAIVALLLPVGTFGSAVRWIPIPTPEKPQKGRRMTNGGVPLFAFPGNAGVCGIDYYASIVPRPSFGLNKDGKPGTDRMEYGLYILRSIETARWKIGPPIVWKKGE